MTDEPLGSHVLELQVADVVEETDDARSLVFAVPDGCRYPGRRLRYAPGPVPDPAGAQRPHRFGGPLLLAVQLTVHRRPADRHRQAHRRRLRVATGCATTPMPACSIHVLAPSGTFVPKTLDTDFLLLAAGSGITPMMAICKSALVRGQWPGRADLRQPRRELGDLRRRAARAGGEVPRSAHRRALAGVRPGTAERGRAGRRWPRRMPATTRTSAARARSWRPPKRR